MKYYSLLGLLLLLAVAGGRLVTTTLELDNGLDWGDWGDIEYCEDGSFATAFEVLFEPYSILDTDETAVNAVRLYCSTHDHIFTGYISSTIGSHGDWLKLQHCSTGFATGMRANVLQPQGLLGDDVAVENVELSCDDGGIITGVPDTKIPQGEWSLWSKCPEESAICGIEVKYNKPGMDDDAGTTDIRMYCCAFDETTTKSAVYNQE